MIFFFQINLIAAPLYVITTTTLDRDEGLKILTNAVDAIRTTIQKFGGEFTEKAAVSLLEFLHLHLIFSPHL